MRGEWETLNETAKSLREFLCVLFASASNLKLRGLTSESVN